MTRLCKAETLKTKKRWKKLSGQGQDRTADLPLFRRSLVPTELPGRPPSRTCRAGVASLPDAPRR